MFIRAFEICFRVFIGVYFSVSVTSVAYSYKYEIGFLSKSLSNDHISIIPKKADSIKKHHFLFTFLTFCKWFLDCFLLHPGEASHHYKPVKRSAYNIFVTDAGTSSPSISVKEFVRTAKDRHAGSLGYAEAIVMYYNKKNHSGLPMEKLYTHKSMNDE